MNHDELLANIDYAIEDYDKYSRPYFYALRAVVELHKSDKFGFCYCSDIPSKCPTKEAIEKELN